MITEEHEQTLFSIPSDMLLCPTTLSGLTLKGDEIGFNRVHPEIGKAVHEAGGLNDLAAGVLLCLKVDNTAREQFVVGMPVSPHSREPLSPYYIRKGLRSLRKLINDTGVTRITLPISAFCDITAKSRLSDFSDPPSGIETATKYLLIKELMVLEAALYDDVKITLVHTA